MNVEIVSAIYPTEDSAIFATTAEVLHKNTENKPSNTGFEVASVELSDTTLKYNKYPHITFHQTTDNGKFNNVPTDNT